MNFEAIFIKLFMSALLGSLIGLEREYHGRPAGLRTHMLVCVGATMITISGIMVSHQFSSGTNIGGEISRIIAGVVTGIGFLGAGAIVRTSDFVRGLTTAACIWFVAALGVVIGLGEYVLAGIGTGVALLILILLRVLENSLADLQFRDVLIVGENREPEVLVENCSSIFDRHNVRISDIDMEIGVEEEIISLLFHLKVRHLEDKLELLNMLSEVEGVTSVQWQRGVGRI